MLFANPCSYYVPGIQGYHVRTCVHVHVCMYKINVCTSRFTCAYYIPRDQGLGTGLVSRVCMAGIVSIVCFSGHHIQNYTCKVYNISEIVIACSDNSSGYDFNRNISIVSTAV